MIRFSALLLLVCSLGSILASTEGDGSKYDSNNERRQKALPYSEAGWYIMLKISIKSIYDEEYTKNIHLMKGTDSSSSARNSSKAVKQQSVYKSCNCYIF